MAKLTDSQIQAWMRARRPLAGKSDGDGLTFTLSAAGAAVWVLRYRIAGRRKEMKLGSYPDITLAMARTLARQERAKIDQGKDVGADRRRERLVRAAGGTFRDLAEDYLAMVGPTLADTTRKGIRLMLDKDVLPALGSGWANEITPAEIVALTERVAKRSHAVARRCFETLSVLFNHGVAKHLIESNPCRTLKVSAIIGAPKPRRERLKLTRDELRDVLVGLPALGRANELSIRILLATCVRKGELLNAKWEHIDLEGATWTIPDENAKNRQGFVIPLAPQVVEWFRELRPIAGADAEYVLPGRAVRYGKRRNNASRTTLNVAINRLAVGARRFSPHDLRSTARSYLAELGVNILVAERCLNHSLGGLVAIYDKHDYLEERRRALAIWASFLEAVERGQGSNVIPLRAA
jgi:integrase